MSWDNAEFVIEDGVEGSPPATMLGVLTQLDEGSLPEMTPFPMLERLASRPRPKPALPRRGRKGLFAVILAGVVLGVGAFVWFRSAGVEEPPPPEVSLATPITPSETVADDARPDATEPQELLAEVEATPEAAAAETVAPRRETFGHLLVVADPWAELTVDGVARGETPLPEIRLEAGSHEVVLSSHPTLGVKNLAVDIVAEREHVLEVEM